MKSLALAPVTDKWEKVRTSLEDAARKIKKTTPGFDIGRVPLTDKKVLASMLSPARPSPNSRPWAPFANVQARMIIRLAKITTPRFEDFMHLKAIWSGKAFGSGLTNEYIARRAGATAVRIYAWTKTINGAAALELSSSPKMVHGKIFQGKIYPCPAELEPVLCETFGLILFRDQLESICLRLAGFKRNQAVSMCCSSGNGYDGRSTTLRKNGAKFLSNAKAKGHSETRVDEILWYIGYEKYSQPISRAESHEYVKYAYLHAFLRRYYPNV